MPLQVNATYGLTFRAESRTRTLAASANVSVALRPCRANEALAATGAAALMLTAICAGSN